MSGYTVGWLVWLAALVALEGSALVNKKPGDTLSEHVWKWFAVKSRGRFAGFRRAVLLMGLAWLAGHFLFPDRF
ncbi:hypothetical protein H9Y04_18195 [Streptomyces sp. TRM66268-LWL]|uniref:Uncharacterized protein n=1 Tax=Streptomyces polyasparticus TaxID=2767826 RepID=A0ABR7SJK3_9ACTN|nr:hypothetical protein [Streptomyces polyasparticus]MBC9714493.1 hypothetical protein [Streptomyces polyasparticus]